MKKIAQAALLISSFAAVLLFLLVPRFLPSDDYSFSMDSVDNLVDGWVYLSRDGTSRSTSLPADLPDAPDDCLTLSRMMPETLVPGGCLCYRTSQQSIRVYAGDTLIYERGTDSSRYLGDSAGSCWNIIPVSEDMAGEMITIELASPFARTAKKVNAVYYGTSGGLLYFIAYRYASAFIAAILFLFVGILLIGSHFALHAAKYHSSILLYLGEFIVLISLWMIGESRMLQFFLRDSFFIINLPFVALLLLPLPGTMYMSITHSDKWQKGFRILFAAYLINFMVCMVLFLSGFWSLYQAVVPTDVLLAAGLGYSTVATVSDMFHERGLSAWLNLISAFILMIFGAAELFQFLLGNLVSISSYIRIGILLIVAMNALYYLHRIVAIAEDEREKAYYEKIAYTDLLTGGLNRSAFYRDLESLLKSANWIYVVQFDVNQLKAINDTYGHAEGDHAICNAARCIRESFGTLGACYRTGGDEFVSLITHADHEMIEEAKQRFQAMVSDVDIATKYPFDIAVGVSMYEKGKDDFQSSMVEADMAMYQDKLKTKQNSADSIKTAAR